MKKLLAAALIFAASGIALGQTSTPTNTPTPTATPTPTNTPTAVVHQFSARQPIMYDIAFGDARAVPLPGSPSVGDTIYYKNSGIANVTLVGLIDGATSRTLYVGEGLLLAYSRDGQWKVVAQRQGTPTVTPA